MADLDRLLADFIEAHLAGRSPDPRELIARADEDQREELAELIDAYFVDAPPRAWDAEGFAGSPEERILGRVEERLRAEVAQAGSLAALRTRARLPREELVERLAELLGIGPATEKLAYYYHRLEHGLLPADGVSTRVFEGLARILGQPAGRLRRVAAEAAAAGDANSAAWAYTRFARPSAAPEEREPGGPEIAEDAERAWDEIDELFLGGSG